MNTQSPPTKHKISDQQQEIGNLGSGLGTGTNTWRC